MTDGARDYNLRSRRHEQHMLAVYRRRAPQDAALLQPLANACRRAAAFDWALSGEAGGVRELWAEGARALAEGFRRGRSGFDPSPDQLILALDLAIAGRDRGAFTTLASFAPGVRSGVLRGAQAFRGARAHFHLAEGYALIASALAERACEPARSALRSLTAAREESERQWWEQRFPDPLEAAWLMREHEAVCALLGAVAGVILGAPRDQGAAEFASAVEEALLRLERFVTAGPNHHPKLYVWLPGIALCALAASAGLPIDWIEERRLQHAPGFSRLPTRLLHHQN